MTDRDLTPAEARAEVEAFMGEGWMCGAIIVGGATRMAFARRMGADRIELESRTTTYRAAVDALKAAWRDAVRPWVTEASSAYNNADMHEEVIARVLQEDTNG